jgi:hypothetical protein
VARTYRANGQVESKLTPSTIDLAYEYLDQFHPNFDPSEFEGQHLVSELLPSKTGLQLYIGVCRATVFTWVKKTDHPLNAEWLTVWSKVGQVYVVKLINGGLGKEFDSGVSKMLLTREPGEDDDEDEEKGKSDADKMVDVISGLIEKLPN